MIYKITLLLLLSGTGFLCMYSLSFMMISDAFY